MEELGTEMLHAMGDEHEDEDQKHNEAKDDLDDDDDDHHHHHSDHPKSDRCKDGGGDDDGDDAVFGAVFNTAVQSLALGDNVAWGSKGPSQNMELPRAGHHHIEIKRSGTYAFNYQVNASPALPPPCVYYLVKQDGEIPGTRFACFKNLGAPPPPPGTSADCPTDGAGIIQLKRGDRVALQLSTTSPCGGVTLDSSGIGGALSAALSLTRISKKKC